MTQTQELHPLPVKTLWYHVGIDFIDPIRPTLKASKSIYINPNRLLCTRCCQGPFKVSLEFSLEFDESYN